MKVREIIRLLEEDGWHLVRTRGSHRQYSETGRPQAMSREYVVVVEKSENGFGAFVPDLPGCIAVATAVKRLLP